MMKKIKLFENFDKIDEVVSKKPTDELRDDDVRMLYTEMMKIVEASPITFSVNATSYSDTTYFYMTGPFGLRMEIGTKKEKAPDSPSYNPSYVKTGLYMRIEKTEIVSKDPEDLLKRIKKSMEFKSFIKGDKVEKLRDKQLKDILKRMKASTERDLTERLLVDYIYYMEPTVDRDKEDNSGPWATSGTSITTNVYDLKPFMDAMSLDMSSESEVSDFVTMIDDLKDDINTRLGNKSSYLVDRTVTRYELDGTRLYIQTKTTVYYN
jgi:hypothetical protein